MCEPSLFPIRPLAFNELSTAEKEAFSVSIQETICSNGYMGASLFFLEWAPAL